MTELEPGARRRKLRAVAEDATGFGAAEVRMTRDLVLDPHAVAAAQGDPDSPYPRSLRYFLTFNGLYLLLVAVLGGFQTQMSGLPEPFLNWAMSVSGKSRDGLMADLDQWYSLTSLPIISLCLYLPLAFLFRRWTGSRDAGSGQAFAYVSGWSLYGAAFGVAAVFLPALRPWSPLIAVAILAMLFLRMGRNVWWVTAGQAAGRFSMLMAGLLMAYAPGVVLTALATLAGALYAP